jgi:hypothetical protein
MSWTCIVGHGWKFVVQFGVTKSLAAHGHVADREGDGMLYSIPLILSLRATREACILGESRPRFYARSQIFENDY